MMRELSAEIVITAERAKTPTSSNRLGEENPPNAAPSGASPMKSVVTTAKSTGTNSSARANIHISTAAPRMAVKREA